MNFSKTTVNALAADINAALVEVAKKHGLQSIRINGGRFDGIQCTYKLEARSNKTVMEDPLLASRMKTLARVYGLPEDFIGREFSNQGRTFKITNLDTKKPKYPVLATCVEDGRNYKFPADVVAMRLK